MSILTPPRFTLAPPIIGSPRAKRWTVDEFHFLRRLPEYEGRRMILVEGEIIDMPAANHPHEQCIGLVEDALRNAFGAGYWVRVQLSLVFNGFTDPVPELSVVLGTPRTVTQQPTSALLVVEAADSSLSYDTNDNANFYAANGIADYWVVDINGRQLIVFRDPIADSSATHGARYQTQQALSTTSSIIPIALPQVSIAVAEFLP